MASEAGKGSAPRKARDDKAYANGWDRIFGTKSSQEKKPDGATATDKESRQAR